MDYSDSEASPLGEGGGFSMSKKSRVGISFQEVISSFEDSVRNTSLALVGQAVGYRCVSG